MRALAVLLSLALPLVAHMVSISTAELRVEGSTGQYKLQMPLYETETMDDPQSTIFEHLRFSSSGQEGQAEDVRCREQPEDDQYVCEATIEFPIEVEQIEVECRLYQVTVPNHVHILRAFRGEVADQAIFDFTAATAEINFIPPSFWETFSQQFGAGARRAAGGLASLLFLIALVLAARHRKELYALAGMFVAGQAVACFLVPLINWHPAPRFVEAAAALTIAYLAVEILLLPEAGQRSLVVGVLGLFHGLYLALFLRETQFSELYVLPGAVAVDLLLIALLGAIWAKLRPTAERFRLDKVLAGILLVFGLGWFFYRLRW